ncbi:MAG: hypothetical protein IT550_11980 [Novosphingobium sp.]|nr:hypothetical protein [Novosphingobium sp.]
MQMVSRLLVGIAGLLGVLVALRLWMAPEDVALQLGVQPSGPFGRATIRADVAGFFGGAGALSIFAAIRNRAVLLTPPLILVGIALTGRIITAASSSITNEMIPPMAIEAGLLAVLALGRLQLAR